jgi:hypothetical protein
LREGANLQFVLPEKWTFEEKDGVCKIMTPEKDFTLVYQELKDISLADFRKLKTFAGVKKQVEDLKIFIDVENDELNPSEEDRINGLKHVMLNGSAKFKDGAKKGNGLEWFMTTVDGPKFPVAFIGYGEIAINDAKLDDFFKTVKKIKDEPKKEAAKDEPKIKK